MLSKGVGGWGLEALGRQAEANLVGSWSWWSKGTYMGMIRWGGKVWLRLRPCKYLCHSPAVFSFSLVVCRMLGCVLCVPHTICSVDLSPDAWCVAEVHTG